MIYDLFEWQRQTLRSTFNAFAVGLDYQASALRAVRCDDLARLFAAGAEISDRIGRNNDKPEFALNKTIIHGRDVAVREEIVADKTFARLIRFKRDTSRNDPKILLVAPMSGHYATLLRDTVEDLLPDHDVYVTDWKNPRDIPVSKGAFDLEDYIGYVVDFMETLGPDLHVAGLSQSTVPVLAATSLLAAKGSKHQPLSMILAGGPIDTRINPTRMNHQAKEKPLHWFRNTLITPVAGNYPGRGREVYPGVLQLAGMVSLDPHKHIGAYRDLFNHVRNGDKNGADRIRRFRNEYETVFDLSAPFYLDTIHHVFHEHSLPRGKMTWRGQTVDPAHIRSTALLTLEGGKDDICAPGQTLAAHALCQNIPPHLRYGNLDRDAGHYELLDGHRIAGFVRTIAAHNGLKHDDTVNAKTVKPNALPMHRVWGTLNGLALDIGKNDNGRQKALRQA